MAWCAAVYCKHEKRTHKDKTFFKLPSDKTTRTSWLKLINRVDMPKCVYLCEDHFAEECFDKSWDLQSRLYYKDRPVQRKLIKGSIPSKFPHKPLDSPRATSVKRVAIQENKELVEEALKNYHEHSPSIGENVDLVVDSFYKIPETVTSSDIAIQATPISKSSSTQFKPQGVRTIGTQYKYLGKEFGSQFKTLSKSIGTAIKLNCVDKKQQINMKEKSVNIETQTSSDESFENNTLTESEEIMNRVKNYASDDNHIIFNSIDDIAKFVEILGYTCAFDFEKQFDAARININNNINNLNNINNVNSNINNVNNNTSNVDNDVGHQSLNDSFLLTEDEEWLEKSLKRAEADDPYFEVESESSSEEDLSDEECENDDEFFSTTPKKYPSDESTYIVYSSKLLELFKYCLKCGSRLLNQEIRRKKKTGSLLVLQFDCVNGCAYQWSSQPILSCKKSAGNIIAIAAVEFAGINVSKFIKFTKIMRLKFISFTTYYKHRGDYVYPEINHAYEKQLVTQLGEVINSERSLELAVDGQCDSPGHNATYNTVSLLDSKTNKILDFNIVHVKEAGSSNAMEKLAFKRSIDKLLRLEIPIRVISTDRHVGIKKLMKEDPYNDILHQFDSWHVAKSILKKLIQASRKKDTQDLGKWARSIVNHLYWSIQTCNGNGKELVERFTSVIHHSVNKHSFPHNQFYKSCEHETYAEEVIERKSWLEMGSPSHEKLIKILTEKILVKDLHNMAEQINTTMLEVFHSVKIRYLPKSVFFRMEKMIAGTQIAILDHNNNCNREQKLGIDSEGQVKPLFSIAYSKPGKRYVAKNIKVAKNVDYINYILRKICNRVSERNKVSKRKRGKRQSDLRVAPPREKTRNEIIEESLRFKRIKV